MGKHWTMLDIQALPEPMRSQALQQLGIGSYEIVKETKTEKALKKIRRKKQESFLTSTIKWKKDKDLPFYNEVPEK